MTQQGDEWEDIVREATKHIADRAAYGATFRPIVSKIASDRGLKFPPEPGLKFVDFLARYPNVVAVMRRHKQDLLVSPADRKELLAQSPSAGIRKDLFEAFTYVHDSARFYDRDADTVVWQGRGDEAVLPSWVPIPAVTLKDELDLRQEFIDSLSDSTDTQNLLAAALATPNLPLQHFGVAVREAGVQRRWHTYRTQRVLTRIQNWAQSAGIPWREEWVTERPDAVRAQAPSEPAGQPQRLQPAPAPVDLHTLLPGLDTADLQRITVPLDLVLKAISAASKRS